MQGKHASIWLTAALVTGGCSTMQEQIQSSGTMGPVDKDYIMTAYELAQLDDAAGKMAPTKAQDPRVVDVSSQLMAQADALEPGLQSALKVEGITAPSQPDPAIAAQLATLKGLQGAAFDRAYVADELALHQRAIGVFQKEDSSTQDGAMRAQVETELPAVQDDTAKLQALAGEYTQTHS